MVHARLVAGEGTEYAHATTLTPSDVQRSTKARRASPSGLGWKAKGKSKRAPSSKSSRRVADAQHATEAFEATADPCVPDRVYELTRESNCQNTQLRSHPSSHPLPRPRPVESPPVTASRLKSSAGVYRYTDVEPPYEQLPGFAGANGSL